MCGHVIYYYYFQRLAKDLALLASRLSRSSAIDNLTPFPLGNEIYVLVPLPMMKTLFNL